MGLVPLSISAPEEAAAVPSRQVTLFHRLGQPFPETSADEVASVDEALLQGTFNSALDPVERKRILREVYRALRPGGQVLFHVLTGNRILSAAPKLPGPAAAVQHVPVDRELLSEIEAAGLVGIYMTKFGASPCFHAEGVEMRETKILAFKPQPTGAATGTVLYKGPFRELSDDLGRTFRRGERVPVDTATWEELKASPAAEQFLFLPMA
jgi:arsenite methyltransferase